MTRSNMHITFSNGKSIICVLDTSSAPEQGYIVEAILLPLLALNNAHRELAMVKQHCTMDERRCNACYRYSVNLVTKDITMFEEHFNYTTEKFKKGKDITARYTTYVESLNNGDYEKGK